jgi:hypothetical protein
MVRTALHMCHKAFTLSEKIISASQLRTPSAQRLLQKCLRSAVEKMDKGPAKTLRIGCQIELQRKVATLEISNQETTALPPSTCHPCII